MIKPFTELFFSLVVIFVGAVLMFNKAETKTSFENACVAAKGNPVFNGKNWECLK